MSFITLNKKSWLARYLGSSLTYYPESINVFDLFCLFIRKLAWDAFFKSLWFLYFGSMASVFVTVTYFKYPAEFVKMYPQIFPADPTIVLPLVALGAISIWLTSMYYIDVYFLNRVKYGIPPAKPNKIITKLRNWKNRAFFQISIK